MYLGSPVSQLHLGAENRQICQEEHNQLRTPWANGAEKKQ